MQTLGRTRPTTASSEYPWCVDVQENLRSGDVLGFWVDELERADQSSSAPQKMSLESIGGHARQQQQQQQRQRRRDDLKPDVSPTCGPFPHQRIVTVSFSRSYVGFLKNWFVVSTKLVDDDVVVEVRRSAGSPTSA